MNIAKLISDVRNHDEFALQQLIEHFTPLIYSIINSYQLDAGGFKISREDLFQEAIICLYDAAMLYEDNDKAKFSTYAYVVIKRKLNRIYYSQIKKNSYVYSFDAFENVDHVRFMAKASERPLRYLDEVEAIERTINLSDQEKKILTMRFENYSYDEIAKELGITKKCVDNRIMRIKRRYQKTQKC